MPRQPNSFKELVKTLKPIPSVGHEVLKTTEWLRKAASLHCFNNGWLRRASLEEPLFQLANGFIELAPHIRMEDDFSHQSDRNSIRQFTGCNAVQNRLSCGGGGQPFPQSHCTAASRNSGDVFWYRATIIGGSTDHSKRATQGLAEEPSQADSLLQQESARRFRPSREPAADSRIFSGWHPIQQSGRLSSGV